MNASPNHIHALTSLRFLAAILVVLFHYGQPLFADSPHWLQNIIQGGYVGVPFFFVLSGFILTRTYAQPADAAAVGTWNPRPFWRARFARVYPVYVVALILSAPAAWHAIAQATPDDGGRRFGLQALAAIGLVQSWIPSWAFTWNGPAWSLSVEAFFYAVFPVIMLVRPGTRRQWLVGLAVTGVAAIVVGKTVPALNPLTGLQRLVGWANPLLWLPLFLLGICAAELPMSARRAANAGTPSQSGWICWLITGVILLLMAANIQRWSQLLYCYAMAPLCTVLIHQVAGGNNGYTRLLSGKVLVLLGEASYSLYILHRPVHDGFRWLAERGAVPAAGTVGGIVLYLITCLTLSVLSYKLIECPCRDWIRQRRRPAPLRAPDPTSSAVRTVQSTP